jgi:hypothetical protein
MARLKLSQLAIQIILRQHGGLLPEPPDRWWGWLRIYGDQGSGIQGLVTDNQGAVRLDTDDK